MVSLYQMCNGNPDSKIKSSAALACTTEPPDMTGHLRSEHMTRQLDTWSQVEQDLLCLECPLSNVKYLQTIRNQFNV